MKDWKVDYLYATFGKRTRYKSEECFVVNAIWQRLCAKKIEIKPVTQQYVRRYDENGHKFALIDLYFPAIKVAIEVDEHHHQYNETNDKLRQKEILRVLFEINSIEESTIGIERKLGAIEINEDTLPTIFRIHTDTSYSELNRQINDVVGAIKKRVDSIRISDANSIIWKSDDEIKSEILKMNSPSININTDLHFKTINEICNLISPKNVWGGNTKRPGYVQLKSTETPMMLWCPQMVIHQRDGSTISASPSNWKNEFINNGRIREWREPEKAPAITEIDKLPRVTFMKMNDALGESRYKFVGVYQIESEDPESDTRIYKRITDEYSWKPQKKY